MLETIGVGVDIEQISRFKEVNDSFLNKIFTDKELKYCFSKANSAQHLAVRFAGKEAIIKAFGSLGKKIDDYKKIEITNKDSGVPEVNLINITDVESKISLSHCEDKAIAFVVIIKKD